MDKARNCFITYTVCDSEDEDDYDEDSSNEYNYDKIEGTKRKLEDDPIFKKFPKLNIKDQNIEMNPFYEPKTIASPSKTVKRKWKKNKK